MVRSILIVWRPWTKRNETPFRVQILTDPVAWGVHCVIAEDAHDQDDMIDRAARIAFRDGFAKAGQRVIIVAGVPLGTPGTTNMVRIAYVGPDRDADI